MKKFLVTVFASMMGFFLSLGIIFFMFFIMMVSTIASSSSKPDLKDNSILHICLNGIVTEQAQDNPLQEILGDQVSNVAVNKTLEAIKKAKNIDKIKGIFIDGGTLASDPASLQEIRKALVDFKKSGKFIFSYADTYTQGAYYLCSTADKIALNPDGILDWHGLSAEPMFYKDLLAKLGIKMQVFKVGTFKSAVEPFTNTEMSDANREQVTSYLNSIWNNFVKDVSDSRKLPVDTLQALADRFMAMQAPEDAVKSEMIDTLVYIDGAKATLKAYAGLKEKEKLNLLSVSDVCQLDDPKAKDSKNKVAVYYAAGSIVDEVASGYSTEAQIVGSKVVEDLQVLEDDENVKAVVLRINSGGGSAYASEQMWHAIKKLDKKKPVIVSMGGMAASGGYYMSSASQYIFAEPTTITGSIGIFGIIPDASELLTQKLGLKFDNVKTNKLADFGSTGRPFNAEESALLQKRIEAGYALFLKRVSMGRNKTPEQVNEIGQGRVWTGEQALEIGLVDKLGTLDEAIEYAAKKAKIEKEYKVTEYPEAEPWYMTILNKEKSSYYESQLRETLGEYFEPFMMLKNIKNSNPIQARMPYYPNIK